MKINIFYKTKVNSYLKKDALFKKVILKGLDKHAKTKMHINVVLVDGKEIKKLNKTFLNHTYETDVIAFEYGIGNKGGEGETFGDVFVCYDVAKKQAKEYKHTILTEMLLLACHGALHFAGYKDKTKKEQANMHKLAENILKDLKCLA